jgi:hypothetical protein
MTKKEAKPSQAQNKPSKIMTQASYLARVRTFKCHPTHVKKPWLLKSKLIIEHSDLDPPPPSNQGNGIPMASQILRV